MTIQLNHMQKELDALKADALHGRPIRHAPAVFTQVEAQVARHHGGLRGQKAALSIHAVELEDVRRAHVGHALYGRLKENQPVHTAYAAHDGLYAPAYGEYLPVGLDVLRLVRANGGPLGGVIYGRPVQAALVVRKPPQHEEVTHHTKHFGVRRGLDLFELAQRAAVKVSLEELSAEERINAVAVVAQLTALRHSSAREPLHPIAALKRVQPASRGRDSYQIFAIAL